MKRRSPYDARIGPSEWTKLNVWLGPSFKGEVSSGQRSVFFTLKFKGVCLITYSAKPPTFWELLTEVSRRLNSNELSSAQESLQHYISAVASLTAERGVIKCAVANIHLRMATARRIKDMKAIRLKRERNATRRRSEPQIGD